MAGYHLWHPAYVIAEPLTFECFITLGDSLFLSRGCDAFVAAALDVAGISRQARAWEMQPMRTHYFNSYRENSKDWEDRWDLAWRLRVVIDADPAPALRPPPAWGYFDLDAADASFNPNSRPQGAPGWPCLVIADADEVPTLEKAEQLVRAAFPRAECVWGKAYGEYPQLRCDLRYFERTDYERGLPEVERVLSRFQEAGAFVRFHNLQMRKR